MTVDHSITKPLDVVFDGLKTTTSSSSDGFMSNQQQFPNRWSKGVSGNPNGRPPNANSITHWIKELLAENAGDRAQKVATIAIKRAAEGEYNYFKEILERTDGKVASNVNFQGVMVHIGDDYARLGVQSSTKELTGYEQLYLTGGTNDDNNEDVK